MSDCNQTRTNFLEFELTYINNFRPAFLDEYNPVARSATGSWTGIHQVSAVLLPVVKTDPEGFVETESHLPTPEPFLKKQPYARNTMMYSESSRHDHRWRIPSNLNISHVSLITPVKNQINLLPNRNFNPHLKFLMN